MLQIAATLRAQWAYVRRRPALLLVWPAIALILGAMLWTWVLHDLRGEQRERQAEVEQHVRAYTASYAARTQSSIADTDRLLLLLRYDWNLHGARTSLAGTVEGGIFSSQHIAGSALVDNVGLVLTSSHPAVVGMDFSYKTYFHLQRRSRADILTIGPPLYGELSEREVVPFTRKLRTAEGSFAGVALVSVFPTFFTQHYAEPILGARGMVALSGADGLMRASRSGDTLYTAARPFMLAALPTGAPAGVARLEGRRWFADGRTRVVGWQRLADTGLLAIVAVDEYDSMAPYRLQRRESLNMARWNSAWLILAALLATSFYVHAKWKQHQMEAIRATYRLATEDAGEGFFINRPLRDLHGVVRDFEIVDCNQYGADMFGKQPSQLIGHRLSEFYRGAVLRDACERLRSALDSGLYDSEIHVGVDPDRLIKAQWIRYKAVRAGDDLAVTIRDISESKAHVTELERRSNSDELTGLPNRYWIQQYLPRAIEEARAGGRGLAVLFIDLDGFKTVNDALGHAAGDELLRTVSKRLTIAVRPCDHVIRLGGDEFVVVLEKVHNAEGVEHVARRVLAAFNDGFHLQQSTHVLGASIGISLFPEHGEDAETLLKHADIAMYAVKTGGKGSFRFFEARFFEEIRNRLETEVELRLALDGQQFVMHYQPRVDLAGGAVASMEALVRWERPGKGLTGPDGFIPLAEETGLIVRLGEQVVDSVCRQLADWSRNGAVLVPVSVNVSPRQFSQCDMLALFREAIARYGIDPALLEIEVTESSMMQNGIGELGVFRQLRALGIKLCIDDFGTGYSSLSQLQKLQFDVLKIDRAFIARIEQPDGGALIASMIAMAHALGMAVVAEGVESDSQMQLLKTLGCDEGQGYYFAHPLAAGERQPAMSVL